MSIFTKIINGDIPSYKIAESEEFLAFLDAFPLVAGHVLVVPKKEIDRLWDLPDDLLAGLLTFAKPLALAVEKVIPCKRAGISVIGLEVPHAHLHIVPMQSADDLNFTRKKIALSAEEMESIRSKISKALQPMEGMEAL
jgi:histidine triad (HIT) family protein